MGIGWSGDGWSWTICLIYPCECPQGGQDMIGVGRQGEDVRKKGEEVRS